MTITPPDWNVPENYLIALLLLALLIGLIWLVGRQKSLSSGRKVLRLALHGLLWLAVLGLWLQPRWQQTLPSGTVLIAADNVPASQVQAAATGLGVKTAFTTRTFGDLKTNVPVDTVWLLGQDFPPALLARLSRQVVRWQPVDRPNEVQQLHWKGVVRQGEQQRVGGRIFTDEGGLMRLRFGRQTVDSTRVAAGSGAFRLAYPVFAEGRTHATLWLGNTLLDTLWFVARPVGNLRVRFVLDAPDFETRALADWLGQQGHTVELTNRLSTGIGSQLTINESRSGTLPDLVVTDPANAGNPLVNKVLVAGKSAIVLNLTRPDVDVPAVARATGTRFQVRRIPGKDTLRVAPNLTALPFRFQPAPGTLLLPDYPVAVQVGGGNRVAVSLLTETFPLRLSGDSAAYGRLWQSVLAQLRPTDQNNVQIDAPVFRHQPAALSVNNARTVAGQLKIGADTLTLRPAPANARSYRGVGRLRRVGWVPVQDTLAVYVYPDSVRSAGTANALAAVARRQQTADWVRAHRLYDAPTVQARESRIRTIEKAIPDWGWLLVISLLLSALWIEPKV